MTPKEKRICDKYSQKDGWGLTHCNECPNRLGGVENWDFRCKANSFYNKHTKEWEFIN